MGNCFKKGEKDPKKPWATSRKARYAIDNSSKKGDSSMARCFEFDEEFDPEMAEL